MEGSGPSNLYGFETCLERLGVLFLAQRSDVHALIAATSRHAAGELLHSDQAGARPHGARGGEVLSVAL